MNDGYKVVPKDEIKLIPFSFIRDGDQDFETGEVEHILHKNSYIVYSYKYITREDMFEDDIITFELYFYLGTHHFPRKTTGGKFQSTTLSVQFTTKVRDKDELDIRMWDYIYSIARMDADQLMKIKYSTFYTSNLQSEEEAEVIEMFKTITYLG